MLAGPAKPPCVFENSIFHFTFCTFADHLLLSTYQAYFVNKPDKTKKAWQGGLMIYPPYLVPEIVSYTYLPVCWQPHPYRFAHIEHTEKKTPFLSIRFVTILKFHHSIIELKQDITFSISCTSRLSSPKISTKKAQQERYHFSLSLSHWLTVVHISRSAVNHNILKLSLSFSENYIRIKIIVNKNIRNNTLLLIIFVHKHSIKTSVSSACYQRTCLRFLLTLPPQVFIIFIKA